MATRKQVVEAARSYIGTPFNHQGRTKGVELDCVGLVLSVAEDLGIIGRDGKLVRRYDYRDYGPQPVGTEVLDHCKVRLVFKPIQDIKPGDVICTKIPENPTHTAIVSEMHGVLHMIHAYSAGRQQCVEHIIDIKWRRRIVAAFAFPNIED